MSIEYLCLEGRIPGNRLRALLNLHKQIFGSSISPHDFRRRLARKRSLMCMLALSGGKLIGYKIGYERNTDEWLGGVTKKYRRTGIATELMKRQHDLARRLGYKRVMTESGNEWREMIILNLESGFDIVGTCTDKDGHLRVIMAKSL